MRTIGLSYPNLSSICDEDFTSDDQTIESSEENRDSFQSRCSSNPDLQNIRDTADSPNSETDSVSSLEPSNLILKLTHFLQEDKSWWSSQKKLFNSTLGATHSRRKRQKVNA